MTRHAARRIHSNMFVCQSAMFIERLKSVLKLLPNYDVFILSLAISINCTGEFDFFFYTLYAQNYFKICEYQYIANYLNLPQLKYIFSYEGHAQITLPNLTIYLVTRKAY